MIGGFDTILAAPPPASAAAKEQVLLPHLVALTRHHLQACPAYAKLVRLTAPTFESAKTYADLPFVPAGLFKSHLLQSVPDSDVRMILTSSGTSGSAVSRLPLDAATAGRQMEALARVLTGVTGGKRLPMLLIETDQILTNRAAYSARAAGVLGFMPFGRDHCFALDEKMDLRVAAVQDFLAKHGSKPFLVFGFTFMVWQFFYGAGVSFDLKNGTLLHSGGWKKLADQAVDAVHFKAALRTRFDLSRSFNFYGMAEQMGTAYLEGADGFLTPPDFGDVLIRDPITGAVLPEGQAGQVQLFSLVPTSYPGHVVLTEDLGRVWLRPDGSKALEVLGRVPKSAPRGCGDNFQNGGG
jgi:hypothetical protein